MSWVALSHIQILVHEALSGDDGVDESIHVCSCRKILCTMLSRALKNAAQAVAVRVKRGSGYVPVARAFLAAQGTLQPTSSPSPTLVDPAAADAAGKAIQFLHEPSAHLQAAGFSAGEAVVAFGVGATFLCGFIAKWIHLSDRIDKCVLMSEERTERRLNEMEKRLMGAIHAQSKSLDAMTEAIARMEIQQKVAAGAQRTLYDTKVGSSDS